MNHYTPTTPPVTRTAADWDAMARAHQRLTLEAQEALVRALRGRLN